MKTRAEINELENRKTIETIDETKSLLFENINKIYRPLRRLKRKKKEKIQINNTTNEPGIIIIDPIDIRRIRKYSINTNLTTQMK